MEDLQSEYICRLVKSFYFLVHEGYNPKSISFGLMAYPSMVFECQKNEYLLHVGIAGNDFGIEDHYPNQEIYISKSTRWSRLKDTFTFTHGYNTNTNQKWHNKNLISVEDYFDEFDFQADKVHYTLEEAALFIQQHLMPVIRGEMWIDELIRRKNS